MVGLLMNKVAVLQHRLLHYRTGFFEALRAACAERSIDLCLVHGQASRRELVKRDEGSLPWAHKVRNRFWEVGARDLVWQPLPAAAKEADLIVVMQESRILSNYPLLLSRLWSGRRVAYWGHGKNFQSDAPAGLRERWKSFLLTRVDWWFAYTSETVDILRNAGYPAERMTQLDNAIDNDGFLRDLASISDIDLNRLRQDLGIPMGARVGLFCGSLYPDKRLGFMIEAADRIKTEIPEFHFVVVGDGPSAGEIKAACESRPWVHWLGVRKGRDKAECFRLADVVLNPGLVGLHVLDSHCAGIPMVTTRDARHSPEIAYLQHAVNGLIVSGGVAEYASAVVNLLSDEAMYQRLCQEAGLSAQRYTLQNMVQQFASGVEACLKTVH